MKYAGFCLILAMRFCMANAQPLTNEKLKSILLTNEDSIFQQVISHPDSFRLQIIYTQINRDKQNKPSFVNYYFNYDPKLYFNPASIVKMPLAFLALEKLNDLHKAGVNKFTTVLFDTAQPWQKHLYKDTTSVTQLPSIAHFIKRAFLVSENDPYNRMYQFVGQQDINEKLNSKGFKNVRITRQFMGLTPEQNRYTNPFRFVDNEGKTIYQQGPAYNTIPFKFTDTIRLGRAHFDRNDSLVDGPYDFTEHNYVSLDVMQQLLRSVMFPKSVPQQQRFDLTREDYTFLQQYLSQYPSETPYPKYDTSKYYDSYVKFFFRNGNKNIPDHIRVFNKVGWSYGFVTDISYVADFKNNVEFMLSATIYVNSDGVINDGKYEYTSVAHPFLYQLGQTIYNYELKRDRKHLPDLKAFKMNYEKRDPADTRPALKQIDN